MTLLPLLQGMRARLGRPHWIVVDEAHHLFPSSFEPSLRTLPQRLERMVFISVHPEWVAQPVIAAADSLLAVGPAPAQTVQAFCKVLGEQAPPVPSASPDAACVFWQRKSGERPMVVRVARSRTEHRRHIRKYAEGELPPDRSFYFRGPGDRLNLRAQNLILFMQLGDGVDTETWNYHLRRGDYSRWIREKIKDDALAADVALVEKQSGLDAGESRKRLKEAIQRHYTLPESPHPVPS
jgi:hypothetical protein